MSAMNPSSPSLLRISALLLYEDEDPTWLLSLLLLQYGTLLLAEPQGTK
jgi:hypothetical protein